MQSVRVLVLGQGFVGEYLASLLRMHSVSYAATTTDGRNGTIAWRLPADASTPADFSLLPVASTVVITFPLPGCPAARRLLDGYIDHAQRVCADHPRLRWIYLGSSRGFKEVPSTRFTKPDVSAGGPRVEAEECVIAEYAGHVLNLVGLWGGARQPESWARFYTSPERLRSRLNDRSLHLIHGADAARAIYAVAMCTAELPAGRGLVSDERVYDTLQNIIGDPRIRRFLVELL
ncbi:hypothetical protein H4S01_003517, partial [Coemansia sp. RSA 2610]